jgi:type VI secretion system protein VasI
VNSHLDLILRCSEGKTIAYVNFADEFMSDSNGGGRVTYRLDKEKVATVRMGVSNDHKALGLWSSTEAIAFIKTLAKVQSMYVAAIPYSESEVSGTFEIEGIEEALKPLRISCKW